jgi:hypothetical protein
MIDYLALFCLLVGFGVVAVKFWNVLNMGNFYDSKIFWVVIVVLLLAWGVYFVCTFTALQGNQVIDLGDGSPLITYTNNSYLILVNLLTLFNWFIGIGVALTAIEFILGINLSLMPKGFQRKETNKGIVNYRR